MVWSALHERPVDPNELSYRIPCEAPAVSGAADSARMLRRTEVRSAGDS